MTLDEAQIGEELRVTRVHGAGGFRRRLLELGLLPGTQVRKVRVAPLGDPIELIARGNALSIRRTDADSIEVAFMSENAGNTGKEHPIG